VGELQFPVDFLKRWLKATNKDMTDETIEKELPQMLEELRWQLAKDQLAKEYKVEVKDEDMLEYAKNVVRMQYMQYGMSHVEDNYLVDFAQRLLKDENQARAIYQRAEEQNILAAVKGVVKLDVKSISYDDFGKLFEQKK
jgi:trigger factor